MLILTFDTFDEEDGYEIMMQEVSTKKQGANALVFALKQPSWT